MIQPLSIILGKAVRRIAKLRGGSGSALPGLFVEKIDPQFIRRTLNALPGGVVLVSGTNGKTTTTKMVVELLEGQGMKVFTNRTGSNFTRGVAAALLGEITVGGKLDADIAVLELDEAHAVHFVRAVSPRHTLLLNVMRDQLDRFGEIDYTAGLLRTIAEATLDTLTLNREDSRVRSIADSIPDSTHVAYFGLDPRLLEKFPDDENLNEAQKSASVKITADVELTRFNSTSATFRIAKKEYTTALKLTGIYNLFNAAAALTTVRHILGESIDTPKLLETLSTVTPAFGRGETLTINGQPLELVLVKNPSGFRLGLSSFSPEGYQTMVAINDEYADGRDMSWLWDVSFESLKETGVAMITGSRCYDMAVRLQYDEVATKDVAEDLSTALRKFIENYPNTPKRIYCTYTAMLALRRELSTLTHVKEIQ
jgi:UDP-N-acetylmuramyl tripeptide synthase